MNPSSSVDPIPEHVALIMDGNRRWAKSLGKNLIEGYQQGAETLTRIVRFSTSLGIKWLTAFSFSTENWRRPLSEVRAMMDLFAFYLHKEKSTMVAEGVRLKSIGDLEMLPQTVQDAFIEVQEATKEGKNLTFVLAINYGGRNELLRATQKMFSDLQAGVFQLEDMSEERFASYLDTAGMVDPDLVIRTAGECRLSNFFPWQSSYA